MTEPMPICSRQHSVTIDAATVIRDLDHDPLAGCGRTQRQQTLAALALRFALGDSFESVTDRVAHEVHQRIHHPLHQKLVDLRFAAAELHDDLLTALTRQIANYKRHTFEDLADLDHAHAHHALAQIAQLPCHAQA